MEEKLEIIKLRENGVSSTKIGSDKNIAESSDCTIYGKREKLQFQATLANPSQNRTRSMDKMESLLSLKKSFKCGICVKKNSQKNNIKAHMESVHEGKKAFKCEMCDKRFSQKFHRNRHMASVHEGRK